MATYPEYRGVRLADLISQVMYACLLIPGPGEAASSDRFDNAVPS
jgi:hypothetical protein